MKEKTVEIFTGKIRGTLDSGIYSFKGVPYGGNTGGQNRFMPPTPVKPWTGIRDATEYGPASWQPCDVTPRGHLLMGYAGIDRMGEDCLVLNVWTPGLNDGARRPVMVWLHGGGFFSGSGDHVGYYDGASLARKGDVVFVSVNHRLGVYGYLYLEGLAGERFAGSGNAGQLDMVQALEWVRDNIAVFGGDPGNVMIFGESGGGSKVATLLAMPGAKGLFHRACSESGPGIRPRCTAAEATLLARELLDKFGLRPDQAGMLQEMKADMIYAGWLAMKPAAGMPMGQFGPVVDGKTLPANPYVPTLAPTAKDIPLIVGTNKDEFTFMMMRDPSFGKLTWDMLRDAVIARTADSSGIVVPVEKVDRLISVYRRTRPNASPTDIVVAISSDRMRIGAIRVAEIKSTQGTAPVFNYLFTWESPAMGGVLKSCHTMEMPFVFNNVEPPIGIIGDGPERLTLAARMSGAWLAFARNGDPNHEGLPRWPAYNKKERATMIFDIECRVENDPRREERLAWEGI